MNASQGCSFQRGSGQIAWCPRGCIKQSASDQNIQINSVPYFGSPAHHRGCGKPGGVSTFGQLEHFYTTNVSSSAQIRCAGSGTMQGAETPEFHVNVEQIVSSARWSRRSVPQEREPYAYSGGITGVQAAKPMPGLRRGDRSCRDRTASSACQFRDSRLLVCTVRPDQILGRAAFLARAKEQLDSRRLRESLRDRHAAKIRTCVQVRSRATRSLGLFTGNESGREEIANAFIDGTLIARRSKSAIPAQWSSCAHLRASSTRQNRKLARNAFAPACVRGRGARLFCSR
jgi:hypothetical protein